MIVTRGTYIDGRPTHQTGQFRGTDFLYRLAAWDGFVRNPRSKHARLQRAVRRLWRHPAAVPQPPRCDRAGIQRHLHPGKVCHVVFFPVRDGFAIQLTRAQARGAKFLSFYPRRLAALGVFGAIHLFLIWWGDILLSYALAGALLLMFRNRAQKTLLYWAGGIFALPAVISTAIYTGFRLGWWRPGFLTQGNATDIVQVRKIIQVYSHGKRASDAEKEPDRRLQRTPATGLAVYALFLFLLGMWVYRAGIVDRLSEYIAVFKRMVAWCSPIGLGLNAFAVIVQANSAPSRPPTTLGFLSHVVQFPAEHITSAGNAAGVALLIQSNAWKRRLAC